MEHLRGLNILEHTWTMFRHAEHPWAPKDKYAKHISQMGRYLGLADLSLMSQLSGHKVLCVNWTSEHSEFPPLIDLDETLFSMHGRVEAPVPRDNDKTWVIAWCRANYEKGALGALSLNHALPLFPREELGDLWDEFATPLRKKHMQRWQKLEAQLNAMSDESDEEDALRESFIEKVDLFKRKADFFNTLMDHGWLPVDVPCDGNCLLWSLEVLRAGFVEQMKGLTNEKVKDKRDESVLHRSGWCWTWWLPCIMYPQVSFL